MFRKNFIFLIFPFCLQCAWTGSLKKNNKGTAKETEKINDKNTDANEEHRGSTINDANNIFSDDIKTLRLKKELFKVKDDGGYRFEILKGALLGEIEDQTLKQLISSGYIENKIQNIKEKLICCIIATAKRYFVRHIVYSENFSDKLKNLIKDDSVDIDGVVDIFKDKIGPKNQNKFSLEIESLIAQYNRAFIFIKNEKFDSPK